MRRLVHKMLERNSRNSLLRNPAVKIHPSAKVNYRLVRLLPGSGLEIGEGSIVEASIVSEKAGSSIVIGRNTFIGASMLASASNIRIGDDVLISWGCNIVDHNSHPMKWQDRKNDVKDTYFGTKDWTNVLVDPVRILNKSWIGLNVIILKGVEIGEGAIVGAGSVVTKTVQPWTIVAGNPARLIREIPIEER